MAGAGLPCRSLLPLVILPAGFLVCVFIFFHDCLSRLSFCFKDG
jgi:hypothetical protein